MANRELEERNRTFDEYLDRMAKQVGINISNILDAPDGRSWIDQRHDAYNAIHKAAIEKGIAVDWGK